MGTVGESAAHAALLAGCPFVSPARLLHWDVDFRDVCSGQECEKHH